MLIWQRETGSAGKREGTGAPGQGDAVRREAERGDVRPGGLMAALARGDGEPIRYVSLGDSLTAGVGAAIGFGYVDWLRGWMRQRYGRRVAFTNLGFATTTSSGLWRLLKRDPYHKERVTAADAMTLCIGGNDLLAGQRRPEALPANAEKFPRRWEGVCAAVRELNPTADLVAMTLYNPCPRGDRRREEWGRWTEAFNAAVRNPATLARYRMRLADLAGIFEGREAWETWTVLGDVHPNGLGHKRIARVLLNTLDAGVTGNRP